MDCGLRATSLVPPLAPRRLVRYLVHARSSAPQSHFSSAAISCISFTCPSLRLHQPSAPGFPSLIRIFRDCRSDDNARRVLCQLPVQGSRGAPWLSAEELPEPAEPYRSVGELLRMSAAEALGVFVVFTSAMTASPGDLVSSAVASGLGVMVMVFALGQVSGAHFNPAVSFAFFSKEAFFMPNMRKKAVLKFLCYATAQFVGSILAAAVATWLTGDITAALTIPTGSSSKAFILEVMQGFLLMFVATTMSTIHKRPDAVAKSEPDWWTPIFIGGTVMFNILLGGRISGASMNPFRSLAPAIWAGKFDRIWIYLIAPTLGAFWGTWTHTLLKEGTSIFRARREKEEGWQSEASREQVPIK